jgi:golgin subfamily B member 1
MAQVLASRPELAGADTIRVSSSVMQAGADAVASLDAARRNAESPGGFCDLTVQLAVVRAERCADVRGAIDLCSEVLAIAPAHLAARETLAAWAETASLEGRRALEVLDLVYKREGDARRRIDLREARLHSADGAERARLVSEIMSLWEQELHDGEAAFFVGLRAFAAGIDRDRLAEALERLAVGPGAQGDLADLMEAAAGELLPGDPGCAPLLKRAARLRERASEREAAIGLWVEVLGEKPGDPEAIAGLERTMGGATAPQASLARLGQIFEKDGGYRRAFDVYARAARAGAVEDEVVSGLRRLLGQPSVRADSVKLLERIFRERKDVREVIELVEMRLEDPTANRISLLVDVARLHESLGERQQAFLALLRAFQLAPEDADIRTALERSAEAAGSIPDLIGSYEDLLDRGLPEATTASLRQRCAVLYADRLGRWDLSAQAWEAAAHDEPGRLDVIRSLREALRHCNAWERFVEVSLRLADLELSAKAQLEVWRDVARECEARKDADTAALCYRRILHVRPTDLLAIGALRLNLERQSGSHHAEVRDLLDREIHLRERNEGSAAVVELQRERDRLRATSQPKLPIRLTHPLDDEAESPDGGPRKELPAPIRTPSSPPVALARVVENADESDRTAALAEAEVFRSYGQWADAVKSLLRARDLEPDVEGKLRRQLESAELLEKESDDPEAAIAAYQKALELAPKNRLAPPGARPSVRKSRQSGRSGEGLRSPCRRCLR